MDLDCGGGAGIVNATSERTGPSWRMVVALGPQVRAYGVFPGGQSGNPGSAAYDDMLETWRVDIPQPYATLYPNSGAGVFGAAFPPVVDYCTVVLRPGGASYSKPIAGAGLYYQLGPNAVA
nr:hypothetical protein [Tanacetum cinerariifolium]